MEKRRFQRIAMTQTATIQGQYSGEIAGEIHDFSAHGLLLKTQTRQSLVDLAGQFVDVCFQSRFSMASYHFSARVVRVAGSTLGLFVETFPAEVYAALLILAKSVSAPFQAAVPLQNDIKRQQALADCKAVFNHFISQVIEHFYRGIARNLNMSAVGSARTEDRWLISNAYPLIELQRAKLEQVYLVDDYVHRQVADEQLATAADVGELSLVALVEFDEWLTISTLTNKLDLEYASDIYSFEERYNILINKALSGQEHPYGPHCIVQTMREVMTAASFNPAVVAILYKLFYEALDALMGDFYQQLNTTLAYIEPLKPAESPSSNPGYVSTTPRSTDSHGSGAMSADSVSLEGFLRNVASMQPNVSLSSNPSFNRMVGDYTQPVVAPNVGAEYGLQRLFAHATQTPMHNANSNVNEVIAYLQQLPVMPIQAVQDTGLMPAAQTVFKVGDAANSVLQSTPGDVNQILSALNTHQMHWEEMVDHIDAVTPWLQSIAPHIPENSELWQSVRLLDQVFSLPVRQDGVQSDIRSLLKKMELALLKLALLDSDFFTYSSHPAQHMVNLLERFYIAADDYGRLFDAQLHLLLNALVNQVVERFEQDARVFVDVNHIVETLLAPIEQTRQYKVTQITTACEQRARLQTAVNRHPPAVINNSAVALLRVGDWLSIMIETTFVPHQIVWINAMADLFVLANRSATTIRELTRFDLAQGLLSGQLLSNPEFDTPFMERGARKLMFSAYDKVYQQAMHDDFTGLLNRKGLIVKLTEACTHYATERSAAILCMIVLNQLSVLYANSDGQEADASLLAIIDVMVHAIPASGEFARLNDNTFVLLLHDVDLAYAENLMKELLLILSAQRISYQDKQFVLGASVGIVQMTDGLRAVSQLLRSASSACAMAKMNGHDSLQVYTVNSEQIKQEESLFKWAGLVDHVLEQGLLYLRCQRIQAINAASNKLPHYEILLGIDESLATTPQEFVLAAERWQRSTDIDLWVLIHSFEWLESQGEQLAHINGVSINLSGYSVSNDRVLNFITERLRASEFIASKIIFEMTETVFMNNLVPVQGFIEIVRALGCRFSLDDFGSGYSSFAYLKNLHVDYLKIDGAFVRDLDTSPKDLAMVKAMHEIGHALGLETIAEYVENNTIFQKLSEIGVDYAQGYDIEMPKPLSSLNLLA